MGKNINRNKKCGDCVYWDANNVFDSMKTLCMCVKDSKNYDSYTFSSFSCGKFKNKDCVS